MKELKILVPILAMICVYILSACSKDNDPADPRMVFVGEYESQEYDMLVVGRSNGSVTGDSLLTVTDGSRAEFSLVPGSNTEIEINLNDVVDDAITTLFSTGAGGSVLVNFEEKVLTKTNGKHFEFESTPFETSRTGWTAPCSITGQGEITGDIITLEYQIEIVLDDVTGLPNSGFSLSGEVKLKKQ